MQLFIASLDLFERIHYKKLTDSSRRKFFRECFGYNEKFRKPCKEIVYVTGNTHFSVHNPYIFVITIQGCFASLGQGR